MISHSRPRVPPLAVIDLIQRRVLDATNYIVYAESSSAMFWLSNAVARRPHQIRIPGLYGSMGYALAGALGCAVVSGKPTIVLSGDGSMHMLNPIPTAVEHKLPLVVIVLNDARWTLPYHGCHAVGAQRTQAITGLPETNFAALARSVGAYGIRVTRPRQLDRALDAALDVALAVPGPTVIDVLITDARPPIDARIGSVVEQLVTTTTTRSADGDG